MGENRAARFTERCKPGECRDCLYRNACGSFHSDGWSVCVCVVGNGYECVQWKNHPQPHTVKINDDKNGL